MTTKRLMLCLYKSSLLYKPTGTFTASIITLRASAAVLQSLWAQSGPQIHSWASASRPMPPASVFRHKSSLSGTEGFRYRTGSPYSATGMIPASYFFQSGAWLTDCRSVRHCCILKNCTKGGNLVTVQYSIAQKLQHSSLGCSLAH